MSSTLLKISESTPLRQGHRVQPCH